MTVDARVEAEASAPRRKRPLPVALIVEARPKQWAKNVLVFAAPGAAGVLLHRHDLLHTLVAFVAFCMAASGTYYLNDARDVEADRHHPKKQFRPIAAGEVPVNAAYVIGSVLIVASIGVALVASWQLAVIVAMYVAETTAYTLWFKHVVMFDIVFVASGFALRAIAGASATHVEISNWFFIVAIFGSLFMVTCKREAEVKTMGEGVGKTRAILQDYTEPYLDYIRTVTSSVVLVAYCLWAFEKAHEHPEVHVPWFQLSIIPFALGILRYALLVDQGHGGEPEEVVFGDRILQVLGVLWALAFVAGIYKLW
ncbi:MAG: decaprenyl-phosphate phosphoribosyltransferase [Acidimicrobiales bacterium]